MADRRARPGGQALARDLTYLERMLVEDRLKGSGSGSTGGAGSDGEEAAAGSGEAAAARSSQRPSTADSGLSFSGSGWASAGGGIEPAPRLSSAGRPMRASRTAVSALRTDRDGEAGSITAGGSDYSDGEGAGGPSVARQQPGAGGEGPESAASPVSASRPRKRPRIVGAAATPAGAAAEGEGVRRAAETQTGAAARKGGGRKLSPPSGGDAGTSEAGAVTHTRVSGATGPVPSSEGHRVARKPLQPHRGLPSAHSDEAYGARMAPTGGGPLPMHHHHHHHHVVTDPARDREVYARATKAGRQRWVDAMREQQEEEQEVEATGGGDGAGYGSGGAASSDSEGAEMSAAPVPITAKPSLAATAKPSLTAKQVARRRLGLSLPAPLATTLLHSAGSRGALQPSPLTAVAQRGTLASLDDDEAGGGGGVGFRVSAGGRVTLPKLHPTAMSATTTATVPPPLTTVDAFDAFPLVGPSPREIAMYAAAPGSGGSVGAAAAGGGSGRSGSVFSTWEADGHRTLITGTGEGAEGSGGSTLTVGDADGYNGDGDSDAGGDYDDGGGSGGGGVAHHDLREGDVLLADAVYLAAKLGCPGLVPEPEEREVAEMCRVSGAPLPSQQADERLSPHIVASIHRARDKFAGYGSSSPADDSGEDEGGGGTRTRVTSVHGGSPGRPATRGPRAAAGRKASPLGTRRARILSGTDDTDDGGSFDDSDSDVDDYDDGAIPWSLDEDAALTSALVQVLLRQRRRERGEATEQRQEEGGTAGEPEEGSRAGSASSTPAGGSPAAETPPAVLAAIASVLPKDSMAGADEAAAPARPADEGAPSASAPPPLLTDTDVEMGAGSSGDEAEGGMTAGTQQGEVDTGADALVAEGALTAEKARAWPHQVWVRVHDRFETMAGAAALTRARLATTGGARPPASLLAHAPPIWSRSTQALRARFLAIASAHAPGYDAQEQRASSRVRASPWRQRRHEAGSLAQW